MATVINATYTKLRSGSWGVRVPEAVRRLEPGDTTRLTVRKLNGQVKYEIVRCFWAGEDPARKTHVALCEIVSGENAPPA